jgi:NAD(P)-dependent dehydrogenase (short-subunit alcohol dehydrogenase family)
MHRAIADTRGLSRRQTELDKAKALIGKNVTAVQGDIANLNDLDRLYETIKKEKGILHIVVASAAMVELAPPSTLVVSIGSIQTYALPSAGPP